MLYVHNWIEIAQKTILILPCKANTKLHKIYITYFKLRAKVELLFFLFCFVFMFI